MLKVYITDLAAYNNGVLCGEWVTLPLATKELTSKIKEILANGEEAVDGFNHEEWFISDYEWDYISLSTISEYEDIYKLNEELLYIGTLDTTTLKAIKYLLDFNIATDLIDAYYKSGEVRVYENSTLEDIAYEYISECYDLNAIPPIIANNIDYYSVGRDLELDGAYDAIGSDIYEYHGWFLDTLKLKIKEVQLLT